MAINKSRRMFILALCTLPHIEHYMLHRKPLIDENSGDEYTVVNGWILKKTDLYQV